MRKNITFEETDSMNVERLALGTAQFGDNYGIANRSGQVNRTNIEQILKTCEKNKISYIDTAVAYGESEEALGSLGVTGYKIVSKLGQITEDTSRIEDFVVSQVEQTLSKLKVSKIHAILLHRPEQLLSADGAQIYVALKKLQEMGYVVKIGVSAYNPSLIKEIIKVYDVGLIQLPLNLIDRRLVIDDFHKFLKDKEIEVHVRSIFLQGLLLLERDNMPKYFKRWDFIWNRWNSWLFENSIKPIDACVQFALSYKEVDQLVIGVDNNEQLREIISIANNNDKIMFPDLHSDDQFLINPSNWLIEK